MAGGRPNRRGARAGGGGAAAGAGAGALARHRQQPGWRYAATRDCAGAPPGDGWGWEPGPKTEWAIGRFIAGLAIKTVVSSAKINLWVAPILNIISQRFLVPDNPDRDELWNRTARLVDAMVTLYLYGSLGIIGFEIGALIGGTGGAIAGPGGIAIGATTIGAAAGSFLAGLVVDAYLKSDLRTKLIDAVVDFIRTQSNPSKPYIDPYIRQGVMA